MDNINEVSLWSNKFQQFEGSLWSNKFQQRFLKHINRRFFYMNINLQLKIKEQKKTFTRHLALEDAWDKLKNY